MKEFITPEEQLYTSVGLSLENAEQSQLFGKPCFKVGGKAFMSLFNKKAVFKLSGEAHRQALSLDGTNLFDPSDKNRPMKEWIEIPFEYATEWAFFAEKTIEYVGSISAGRK